MKRKKLKIILLILVSFLVITSASFTIHSSFENNKIKQLLEAFKKDAEFVEYSSKYNINFYKVSSDYKDITPTFTEIDGILYPGYKGDVLTTLKNEIGFEPFTSIFSSWFGGHACMVVGDTIIEAAGNNPVGQNYVTQKANNWFGDHTKRYSFIGLKINASEQERANACQNVIDCIGNGYNYSFILPIKNTYYCSDLISKAFKNALNSDILNLDGGITSVQDIITSSYSSISIYKEKNNFIDETHKGNYNLYYLDDGNDYHFN